MAESYFFSKNIRNALPLSREALWRLESWAIGAFFGLLRRLPLVTAVRVAEWLFALVGPHTPRVVQVRGNLTVAFPDRSGAQIDRLVRASYAHMGRAMVELARLDRIWAERHERVEFVIEPGAVELSPDRQTVFVTAHLGAWQLTPATASHYGLTMPIIYAPEDNPYVDRRLKSLRRAFGGPLISRNGGVRALMRALDQGQSIGLTSDTRLKGGEMMPFFGAAAETNTMPARLALRYGCPLVPVWAERLPNAHFRIHICASVQPRNPEASVPDQARDMTAQLNGIYETWIRAVPGEWLCFKRRWPKAVYRPG